MQKADCARPQMAATTETIRSLPAPYGVRGRLRIVCSTELQSQLLRNLLMRCRAPTRPNRAALCFCALATVA